MRWNGKLYKIQCYKKISAAFNKLKKSNKEIQTIIDNLRNDPFADSASYERLLGDLSGYYSRRIGSQHHLIYYILDNQKIIRIVHI
jgi:Txe/YoeB family toxin of toxin-antitoxin system